MNAHPCTTNHINRYNSVWFSISRMRLTIVPVISSQKSIALIKIWEKWLLGGQNGDFILLKLNNQLVNHRVTRWLTSLNLYGQILAARLSVLLLFKTGSIYRITVNRITVMTHRILYHWLNKWTPRLSWQNFIMQRCVFMMYFGPIVAWGSKVMTTIRKTHGASRTPFYEFKIRWRSIFTSSELYAFLYGLNSSNSTADYEIDY